MQRAHRLGGGHYRRRRGPDHRLPHTSHPSHHPHHQGQHRHSTQHPHPHRHAPLCWDGIRHRHRRSHRRRSRSGRGYDCRLRLPHHRRRLHRRGGYLRPSRNLLHHLPCQRPPKRIHEGPRRRVPVAGLLRQCLCQDPLHPRRQVGPRLADGWRRLVHHLVHQRQRALGLEGHPAAQHLVGHHRQAVEVGARIHRQPLHLLRAHILRCAHQHARRRQPRLLRRPRNAEVGQRHLPRRAHDDVVRLDVPVHQPPMVGVVQRLRQRAQDGEHLVGREGPPLPDDLGQRLPLQVLHHEVVPAPFLSHVVDGNDVGVLEPCCRPSLAQEALDELLLPHQVRGQHFDRYIPVEQRVVSLVDRAHPTAADLGLNLVFAQPRAAQIIHLRLLLSRKISFVRPIWMVLPSPRFCLVMTRLFTRVGARAERLLIL